MPEIPTMSCKFKYLVVTTCLVLAATVQFEQIHRVAVAADPPANTSAKKKVLFIAGKQSHGFAQHEHNAGCMLLAKCLNESGLPIEAVVAKNGWPADPK